MKSLPYSLATTNDHLTSCDGLLLLTDVMNQLDLSELEDRHFPAPGSNQDYLRSD